ncbi:uncharacterized protein LOC110933269 [Helianthus annuus]|uniref:uncharacterized protein LOC110933269 n=1 Tax=Helianthus annuus TaxID=4232 RepID=UPI000B8EFB3F|nr:uncharacterized protein LOC110933269 [Helianthus annuus]
MGKTPTLAALAKRGVVIDDTTYILCNSGEENDDHLFTRCIVAAQVWFMVSRWCKIAPVIATTIKEVLEVHNQVDLACKARGVFCRIVRVACWCIWRAHNSLGFDNKQVKVAEIISDIKSLGFLWICNRSKDRNLYWEDWCRFVNM